MQNKAKAGVLMFLLGMIFTLLSFYSDAIRGMETNSIGLYQVIGAIVGYLIAWIGIILLAKTTQITKTIKKSLYYGGAIIFLIALFADFIGLGDAPGIDSFQIAGMIFGVVLAGVGFIITPKLISEE